MKVSELTVKKKGDWILVEFKLCLVMQDAKEGYLEDELKKWKKFVNESVTEVDFGASGELILALYIYIRLRMKMTKGTGIQFIYTKVKTWLKTV